MSFYIHSKLNTCEIPVSPLPNQIVFYFFQAKYSSRFATKWTATRVIPVSPLPNQPPIPPSLTSRNVISAIPLNTHPRDYRFIAP